MDSTREDKPKPPSRPEKSEFKVTGRVETKFQMVTRCNNCAAEIQVAGEIQVIDRCRNCGNDLHSCRNCLNFDPAARNECIQPVEIRVVSKNKNNFCTFFKARVLIEKQGSGAAPAAQDSPGGDPRLQAFHDLFKN